jgi:hypothetical protein
VVNPALVSLLTEALTQLPAHEAALRARVLARLAGALQPAADPLEPVAIAREAIAVARELGDEETLRVVLHGAGSALADYAPAEERLDVDRQTFELAARARDRPLMFRAQLRLFFDHAELGAWTELEASLAACEALADELRRAHLRWYVALLHTCLADLRGESERAQACEAQSRALLDACEQDDARRAAQGLHHFGRLVLWHRHEQLLEHVPVLPLGFTPAFAGDWRASCFALCHAREGRLAEAERELRRIAPDSFAFHHDLSSMHMLAETCILCELGDVAARLLLALEPRRHCFVTWGVFGSQVFMPVSALIGALSAVLGRFDEALAAFDDAVTRCRLARARPALARVLYDQARARLGRAHADDRAVAAQLLEQSEQLARELAMPALLEWIERARTRHFGAPEPLDRARPSTAHAFTLVREGDVWLVTHGPRAFRLKHTRGLAMLSQLIEQPGREQHALALGAEGDAGELGDAGALIDRVAIEAYRARLEVLRDQEQTAESLGDADRADGARQEIERIAQHLSAALGLGGKERRSGSASERARVNVQRRIKDALVRIGREDPELARYLSLCVRTGTFSVFEPVPSRMARA